MFFAALCGGDAQTFYLSWALFFAAWFCSYASLKWE
jgi:hypothetical protein